MRGTEVARSICRGRNSRDGSGVDHINMYTYTRIDINKVPAIDLGFRLLLIESARKPARVLYCPQGFGLNHENLWKTSASAVLSQNFRPPAKISGKLAQMLCCPKRTNPILYCQTKNKTIFWSPKASRWPKAPKIVQHFCLFNPTILWQCSAFSSFLQTRCIVPRNQSQTAKKVVLPPKDEIFFGTSKGCGGRGALKIGIVQHFCLHSPQILGQCFISARFLAKKFRGLDQHSRDSTALLVTFL